MRAISYSEARQTLATVMDDAQKEPILLTRRRGHPSVVVMSLADFSALTETAHLLSSEANRRRLVDAISSLPSLEKR